MLELAGIIILGVLAQWFAWRLRIPAILPLILIGLIVGPLSSLYTPDGSKWIEPMWNADNGNGLFPGERLFNFVSLAISIILFEGGLTLKRDEILNVGPVIMKLISIGSLVTFIGAAIAAHFLIGLDWSISFLFSSLIIVTGPTVITPILRNLPLKKDLSAILKWEGILIDPIGALVAVLVFEFISVGGDKNFTFTALTEFFKILIVGFSIGLAFGFGFYYAMKHKIIPHYLINVVALSTVLLAFVASDFLAHESGLLSVVIMGMVLGNLNVPNLKEILHFKESLSILLISMLFILLSANIKINDFDLILNIEALLLFLTVVFIIRPIGVFLSSKGSTLKTNEKIFISWVGPRGIVAAGIASLFGLKLSMKQVPGAEYITPLVFLIVLGTVLLNATTARKLADYIGVTLKSSNGILIVGATKMSRLIATYLQQNGRHVVLIDNNSSHIQKARKESLEAIQVNIHSEDLSENIELNDIGYLMALTSSTSINQMAIKKFENVFGGQGSFRLISNEERLSPNSITTNEVISIADDFLNIVEVVRDYPETNEIKVNSNKEFRETLALFSKTDKSAPLLYRKDDKINVIASFNNETIIEENTYIMYLGQNITEEIVPEIT